MKTFAFLVRSLAYVVIAVAAVQRGAQTPRADAVRLDAIAREAREPSQRPRELDQTADTPPPLPGASVDLTLDEATRAR